MAVRRRCGQKEWTYINSLVSKLLLFTNVPLLTLFTEGIEAPLVRQGSRCVRMLQTHPLLQGTYPISTSPWPGLWQVHTHYGIPHINASLLPIGRQAYGECVRVKRASKPTQITYYATMVKSRLQQQHQVRLFIGLCTSFLYL